MSKRVPPDAVTERDAIDELADSFVARLRAGERPSVEEYAQRYPKLADQVRELLPALVMLEQHGLVDDATRAEALPRAEAPIPSEIGEFTIVREIGRGGMGVVYEAIQQSLGRHVALKVLPVATMLSPTHLERFRVEARAAARLHHTHIVPVFGVGEHEGLHFYAMQFIAGQSLDAVIQELRRMRSGQPSDATTAGYGAAVTQAAVGLERGQLPREEVDSPRDPPSAVAAASPPADDSPPSDFPSSSGSPFYQSVARVGLQVAEALAYAHAQGILHRDVKPSNLLLDARGNVWITDFGLAKDETADGLTQTGDFVGTLRYMSPERIDGWSDPRSDVYSLGATLYELLTLRPLFDDSSRGKLVENIYYNAPPAPSKRDPSVPADLETIILKALAKEPAERYRSADEMAEDLRRFLVDRPILARRSTFREQVARWVRRNPLAAALAGVVAALALLAAIVLAVSNARIRRESQALAVAVEQKDSALSTAQDAIDQMLTRTANEALLDAPRLHPMRLALLEDALRFYDELAANPGADPELQHEVASVLQTKAGLERELDQYEAAAHSLERCIALLEPLVDNDPHPPAHRQQLALAEQELALTWIYAPGQLGKSDSEIEALFRQALARFDEIERRWPGQVQPVVLASRHLSQFAYERGDLDGAERILRSSIDRGEAYVAQHPDDLIQSHELGWASIHLGDMLFEPPNDRYAEAVQVLLRGLRPLDAQLQEHPDSSSAIDVATAMRFRLGQVYCLLDRGEEAVAPFEKSIRDMEALCEAFPWNHVYWANLNWFHEEMARSLRQAGLGNRAGEMLLQYRDWLAKMAPLLPAEAGPHEKLQEAQRNLVDVLRTAGLESDADDLADQLATTPVEP
jgi:serine/threonine protein kinase